VTDLLVPAQRRPGSADPVAALAARMRDACATAVDVDEVAAILEASGINDRIAAAEYGAPTVFALAQHVVARTHADGPPPVEPAVVVAGPGARRVVVDTLVRSAIYLAPLGIGAGAAPELRGLPALVTTGTLLLGWGGGQALAYLGYRTLSEHGAEHGQVAAARLLGTAFAGLTLAWFGVLAVAGVPGPRGYAVAAAQLALFAVATVALVTNRERPVLTWTVPCWLAAGGIALGLGWPAAVGLLAALGVLVAVAFRPAARTAPAPVRRRTWQADLCRALLFGVVGTGQAALLMLVVSGDASSPRVPPELVPLLIAVPLIELTLVWHQRRVAAARAVLASRAAFDRRLARVTAGTVAALAVPVGAGAGIAVATWFGARPPGGQALAAATLLTGVFALCLVLAAYRRAGTAAILVWWPALLVAGVTSWAPALVRVAPQFPQTLAVATLLGASLPGLVVAAFVLRDPESYR
jgi:hypothetical protein